MKKIFALIMALLMLSTMLMACGRRNNNAVSPDTPSSPDTPDDPDTPNTPDVPNDTDENEPIKSAPANAKGEIYIIVANDHWTLKVVPALTEDAKPATWTNDLGGLTGYSYGGVAYLAPEGQLVAVKESDINAYATGEIADEDVVYIDINDTKGNLVGTQVIIDYDAATSAVKSIYKTGKSVMGKLTVTKEGDKYTVKVDDKVYLDGVAATEKIADKVYDAISSSCYYVSSATKKAVFAFNSAELFDLSTLMSDDTHDITTVGMFYDELYNINYEGYFDAYDYNGDGKLDLIVVNRPVVGKVTGAEGFNEDGSLSYGVLGDNHSYCNCGGWHTQSSVMAVEGNVLPVTAAKNDFVMIYEDYTTGAYTVINPKKVEGNLTKIDGNTVYIGTASYTVDNTGDLPYVNGKNVTQFETDEQQAVWKNAVGQAVTLYIDKLGNVVAATLPALPT